MSKAKAKTTTKPIKQASPDDVLVLLCLSYARAAAAVAATYTADPDPNNKHAEKQVGRFENEAFRLLEKIATSKPTTAMGIRAKAAIVPAMIRADDDGLAHVSVGRLSLAFMLSFAQDVDSYMREVVAGEWKADQEASRVATKL